jgi:hypothetical protein
MAAQGQSYEKKCAVLSHSDLITSRAFIVSQRRKKPSSKIVKFELPEFLSRLAR